MVVIYLFPGASAIRIWRNLNWRFEWMPKE